MTFQMISCGMLVEVSIEKSLGFLSVVEITNDSETVPFQFTIQNVYDTDTDDEIFNHYTDCEYESTVNYIVDNWFY